MGAGAGGSGQLRKSGSSGGLSRERELEAYSGGEEVEYEEVIETVGGDERDVDLP